MYKKIKNITIFLVKSKKNTVLQFTLLLYFFVLYYKTETKDKRERMMKNESVSRVDS